MTSFNEFKISEELKSSIDKMGFKEATLVQAETIPLILEGKDVLAESATGSGKTLAFGCGVLEKSTRGEGIQSLILTPTRELAEQVTEVLKNLAKGKKLKVTSVYGGVAMNPQITALKNAEIVVATPGRLKDHMQRGTIDSKKIKILVLDEADRMLDMGFIDDIEFIMKQCPKKDQTLFFSATVPAQIAKLSKKYLNNPVKVSAKKQVDPTKLSQIYYDVPSNIKFSLLVDLLKKDESSLSMVFCNTRRYTDIVAKNLKKNGIHAMAIHGGFAQNKRDKSINNFKEGKIDVLVCTDVAARGIHVDDISHVYNYDLPNDPNDYVHRIGRTARAGKEGRVVNLLSRKDHDSMSKIMSEFRSFSIEKMKRPFLEEIELNTTVRDDDNPRNNYRGQRRGPRRDRPSSRPRPAQGDRRRFSNDNRNDKRRPKRQIRKSTNTFEK